MWVITAGYTYNSKTFLTATEKLHYCIPCIWPKQSWPVRMSTARTYHLTLARLYATWSWFVKRLLGDLIFNCLIKDSTPTWYRFINLTFSASSCFPHYNISNVKASGIILKCVRKKNQFNTLFTLSLFEFRQKGSAQLKL